GGSALLFAAGCAVKTAPETDGVQLGERGPERPELLEREAELLTFETLLGDVSALGRLLAIEGPPGIGKTSLILEGRMRARRAGVQVLSARGSELENTFSFGVVRQLFEQFLVQLPEHERAKLLQGAAELPPPLFQPP